MNILLTTAHLADFAGSELFTVSLTQELSSRGHSVTVYSPILGRVAWAIDGLRNVELVNDLEKVKNKKFDVVHIQHNVTAWVVRKYFPEIPAVMGIHGVIPALEQPPQVDLGMSKYIVVSEEISDHLQGRYSILKEDIEIIHNWVDQNRLLVILL
jgi:hypothetical protein